MQKESAPNYYPPLVRRQMQDYMTKTSIKLEQGAKLRHPGLFSTNQTHHQEDRKEPFKVYKKSKPEDFAKIN